MSTAATPPRTSIDSANRMLQQMFANLAEQEAAFKVTVAAKDAEIATLRAKLEDQVVCL